MSRTHFKNQLLNCYKAQKACDVWFNLSSQDCLQFKLKLSPTKIGAHKFVLSLASDVFDTMFNGEAIKQGLLHNETLIDIPDITPHIFDLFLR